MRVVVADSLTLEPGTFFRSGSSPTDGFAPNASSPPGNGSAFDQNSSSLFGGEGNSGLENIDVQDLPAAAINDATNGDLFLETAVPLDDKDQLGDATNGLFQVTNDSAEAKPVAIRFTGFGPDGDGDSGDLSKQQVVETFEFYDSGNNHISTDDPDGTGPNGTVAGEVSIAPGTTEQIYLEYDTEEHASDLRNIAGASQNPFNNSSSGTTIDLVDSIEVGVDDQ
ncbi:hypothetical protein [Halorubrum sp. SY-15]|uniref:hypothetical protein n=1 Tax=Halorubrum sp. SY-15 TaxID=3402277 RepID=UPI003EC05A1D